METAAKGTGVEAQKAALEYRAVFKHLTAEENKTLSGIASKLSNPSTIDQAKYNTLVTDLDKLKLSTLTGTTAPTVPTALTGTTAPTTADIKNMRKYISAISSENSVQLDKLTKQGDVGKNLAKASAKGSGAKGAAATAATVDTATQAKIDKLEKQLADAISKNDTSAIAKTASDLDAAKIDAGKIADATKDATKGAGKVADAAADTAKAAAKEGNWFTNMFKHKTGELAGKASGGKIAIGIAAGLAILGLGALIFGGGDKNNNQHVDRYA